MRVPRDGHTSVVQGEFIIHIGGSGDKVTNVTVPPIIIIAVFRWMKSGNGKQMMVISMFSDLNLKLLHAAGISIHMLSPLMTPGGHKNLNHLLNWLIKYDPIFILFFNFVNI